MPPQTPVVTPLSPDQEATLLGNSQGTAKTEPLSPEAEKIMLEGTKGGLVLPPKHQPPSPRFGGGPPPTPVDVGIPIPLLGEMATGAGLQVSPSTAKGIIRTVVPAAGSIAGGTLGAELGGPGGAVAGSGAGAIVGELGSMGLESLAGAPPTAPEFFERAAEAGGTGLVGEGLARTPGLLTAPARAIASRTLKSMTPAGREATDMLGGHVTPGQVSDSPFLKMLDNIVASAPTAGRRYKAYLGQQIDLLKQKADDIIGAYNAGRGANRLAAGGAVNQAAGTMRAAAQTASEKAATELGQQVSQRTAAATSAIGTSPGAEATGQTWQALQDAAHQAAKDSANALYQHVDQISGGVRVPLDSLKEFVETEEARRGKLGMMLMGGKGSSMTKAVTAATTSDEAGAEAQARHLLSGKGMTGSVRDQLISALQDAGINADTIDEGAVSFRQAHEIRSALGRIARSARNSSDPSAKQAYGIASQLQNRIDSAMTEAAGGKGSPLRRAYDEATNAYKQMATTFEDGVLQKAADTEPRLVTDTIIKQGRVADILKAKAAVGDDAWKTIQAQHWHDLTRAPDGSPLDPKAFLKKLRTQRPETLKAVYGDHANLIEDLREPLEQLGDLPKAGTVKPGPFESAPYDVITNALPKATADDVNRIRTVMGPQGWAHVQAADAENLLKNPDGSLASGKQIMSKLGERRTRGNLDAVYPNGADRGLWSFARVLSTIQGAKPTGTGSVWIQLRTAGAVGTAIGGAAGIATGDWDKAKAAGLVGAGAVLLTPPMLARILTSPSMRTALLTGMKATGPSVKARAVGQILSFLTREGLVSQDVLAKEPDLGEESSQGPGPVGGRTPGMGLRGAPPPRPSLGGQ